MTLPLDRTIAAGLERRRSVLVKIMVDPMHRS